MIDWFFWSSHQARYFFSQNENKKLKNSQRTLARTERYDFYGTEIYLFGKSNVMLYATLTWHRWGAGFQIAYFLDFLDTFLVAFNKFATHSVSECHCRKEDLYYFSCKLDIFDKYLSNCGQFKFFHHNSSYSLVHYFQQEFQMTISFCLICS